MKNEIQIIDNSSQQIIEPSGDLYKNRKIISNSIVELQGKEAEVTIVVQVYNQLEKAKRCVESVLKYTTDVKYELILFDNGSTEPVLEYFQSVQYPNKKIIRVEKNISAGIPGVILDSRDFCSYYVSLVGDIIVTKNWLTNMLKVAKSDPQIGLVNPVCNNASNLQSVELQYSDWDDMQRKAADYNISTPEKWEERIRIITLGTLYKRECLIALGWPLSDVGFMHDFGDDDIAFRVRRAGYKVILARDTWICHDHPVIDRYGNEKVEQSIIHGRKNFRDKYYGIDAWDDVNNYVFYLIGGHIKDVANQCPRIMGIDVKCGTPILDIKNQIRRFGKFEAELSAFTQEDKYSIDLHTICTGDVVCDREEFFTGAFPREAYDYIIFGRDINRYHEPSKILLDAYDMLHPGGQMFFSLKNMGSILSFLHMLGFLDIYDKEYCLNYPFEVFMDSWKNTGINIRLVNVQYLQSVSEQVQKSVRKILDQNGPGNQEEMMNRLMIDKYWFVIEK